MKIFVNTGAWKALYDKDDLLHELAKNASKQIQKQMLQLITSNFILDKTYTLLRTRAS